VVSLRGYSVGPAGIAVLLLLLTKGTLNAGQARSSRSCRSSWSPGCRRPTTTGSGPPGGGLRYPAQHPRDRGRRAGHELRLRRLHDQQRHPGDDDRVRLGRDRRAGRLRVRLIIVPAVLALLGKPACWTSRAWPSNTARPKALPQSASPHAAASEPAGQGRLAANPQAGGPPAENRAALRGAAGSYLRAMVRAPAGTLHRDVQMAALPLRIPRQCRGHRWCAVPEHHGSAWPIEAFSPSRDAARAARASTRSPAPAHASPAAPRAACPEMPRFIVTAPRPRPASGPPARRRPRAGAGGQLNRADRPARLAPSGTTSPALTPCRPQMIRLARGRQSLSIGHSCTSVPASSHLEQPPPDSTGPARVDSDRPGSRQSQGRRAARVHAGQSRRPGPDSAPQACSRNVRAGRRAPSRRSPIFGDVRAGPQGGAQNILGGIGLRAGGDRVCVRPVQVAEADGVVGYLGVVPLPAPIAGRLRPGQRCCGPFLR
jgi:hypothetical protein